MNTASGLRSRPVRPRAGRLSHTAPAVSRQAALRPPEPPWWTRPCLPDGQDAAPSSCGATRPASPTRGRQRKPQSCTPQTRPTQSRPDPTPPPLPGTSWAPALHASNQHELRDPPGPHLTVRSCPPTSGPPLQDQLRLPVGSTTTPGLASPPVGRRGPESPGPYSAPSEPAAAGGPRVLEAATARPDPARQQHPHGKAGSPTCPPEPPSAPGERGRPGHSPLAQVEKRKMNGNADRRSLRRSTPQKRSRTDPRSRPE